MRGTRATLRARIPIEPAVVERLAERLSSAAGRDIEVETRVDPRLDASAVLFLGEDRRIVLDARFAWLRDVANEIERRRQAGYSTEDTYEHLRTVIETTEPELRLEEVVESGHVLEVGDGIAVVSGMGTVGSQEVVEFENGAYGIAFSLMADKVGCILLGPEDDIREGSGVKRTGHVLKVPVGPGLKGRIVDALGRPIDGRGPIAADVYRPVERKAPGVVDRQPVNQPLHTGLKVIDALVPLGRGQRELIIGDRTIGKTTIAIDTILSQRSTGVQCVYTSIGQKASSVARVVHTLEEHGALEYTTVVVALPNEQPAFRHEAPYTACAIGEYVMDGGGDALVIYDDLSKHAVTYREMSALLKRPIGREAYPGDIFYVHSRLLERAARMSDELGGGSLTALPIVETLAGDISAFIPTNVISICDGQIMLDTAAFNESIRPPMDVGLSVSRVGGAAQNASMKSVAGRLRIDLAQYQEMAQFVKFGAEVDQATLDQLTRGERCRELLKQGINRPLPEAHEVLVLYAGVNGLLDDLPLTEIGRFEAHLIEYVVRAQPGLLSTLETGVRLESAVETAMRSAIAEARGSFVTGVEPTEPLLDVGEVFGSDEEAEDA
ncbi:MAG: F0F1 ATP synthase subunit alpha [Actinobacteria bacterium]|nr:F0F1 ATP synthase subunit alpha [Actinomycetota bacterium]